MTKEQKIDTIYKKVANKELELGCKIICRYWSTIDGGLNSEYQSDIDEEFIYLSHNEVFSEEINEAIWFNLLGEKKNYAKIVKIIGHPVMIGDVLDYCKKNGITFLLHDGGKIIVKKDGKNFAFDWLYFNKSIEEQNEECIDYVYNLIK